jgi:outer membrane protein
MTAAMRSVAIGIAAMLMAMSAFADDYKIGVMHVERIMRQSKPAREAQTRIEQEFKARDADITRKEQEVQAAAAQFAKDRVTLSPGDAAERERVLDLRTREVQRLRQQFAEDLRGRQFEELDKLKARLDHVLTQYAKDNHFDLILRDALFVGRAVDITDDVIKGLEK